MVQVYLLKYLGYEEGNIFCKWICIFIDFKFALRFLRVKNVKTMLAVNVITLYFVFFFIKAYL